MEKLIKEIQSNAYFSEILNSDAMQRLKNISFLGAIDYSFKGIVLPYSERNRYAHSLAVGCLALYICKNRKYSEERTKHIVTAALLHDIGHAPLSHSSEDSFKLKYKYAHHFNGELIISGLYNRKLSKQLNAILENKVDNNYIIALLNKEIDNNDGGDIFNSPLNIDTIDGIYRSLSYFGYKNLNVINICNNSFLNEKIDYDILDEFWKSKHLAYSQIINSKNGLISDYISKFYFDYVNLEDDDFIKSEKSWHNKYQDLFTLLRKYKYKNISLLKENKVIFRLFYDSITDKKIPIRKRVYSINTKKLEINDRYICNKDLHYSYILSNYSVRGQESNDIFK